MQLTQRRLSFLGSLPNDAPGTHTTLKLMAGLVRQFKRDPMIRDTAISLVAGLRPKDWSGEARLLYEYVRDRIRYTRDVSRVETLQTPPVTMELEAGDCDDKSTLLAALLESVGHPTRFVATGYRAPQSFSHVYVESLLGTKWVPLDATTDKPFGWVPRTPVSRMVVFN
jgi:transglutaminase-like putative cysteine protease